MGILLQITIQKCDKNVKRTIKISDMALLLMELVESFAIAICHPRRAHRLRVFRASLSVYSFPPHKLYLIYEHFQHPQCTHFLCEVLMAAL